MQLQLEPVSAGDLSGLRHLTFPSVLKIAQERYPATVRAIVAQTADEAAGLAISVPGPLGQFELLSLHITPFFRRLGFGSRLLRAVEEDHRIQGYTRGVHFMNVAEHDQANAHFFMANGWSRPICSKVVCYSSVELAFQTPWLVRARLPERYRVVDWLSLGPTERAPLQAAVGDWIGDDVNPFAYEADCDPSTSVALVDRESDAVRGWTITHRLDDRTLRWTCSYLLPALQVTRLAHGMWLEVARRQRHQSGVVNFCFSASVTEPRMTRFALRRMRPWLSCLTYGCATTKKVA